jgi:GIY-YIG catalytic domain
MPRKPIDYSKSLVYRIAYKDITYYVGSTTNFRNRKNQHKNNCKSQKSEDYNKPLYKFIRENGGWSDEWVMVLIQSYPNCKTSIELRKYEREHYDILKPEFNVLKPFLKEGEKEEYQKEYCKSEKNKEYKKEYNKENANTIKEKRIQYCVNNAEKISENKKRYYVDNAEKLKEKHTCECGGKFTISGKAVHKNTQKHTKTHKIY